MNKFAVITGRKRKKFFKRPTIAEQFAGEHSSLLQYVTLELPYTIEQMRTIDEHKLNIALAKGIKKLQQAGISRAIFTNTLKEIFEPNLRLHNFRIVDGKFMFFEFSPKMIDWLCDRFELEPPNIRINVREEKLSFVGQNLIEKLCYKAKFMSLATADIISSKRYADFLMEQLGFMLDIQDIAEDSEENADIVIDVDNFLVKIPQKCEIDGLVIEDAETIEDTDIFDVLMCRGLGANDVFVSKWKCGDLYVDIMK